SSAMPGTAYARRPTSRRRRWERSRAHLGSKSAESRSIVLTRHSPGGYLLSGWEVSSHHGSDGSARKLKKAGEQRLAVSRSHSRRPHKILHTFMSSQAVDYDDLEATTNIEEITGDELNQNTLRSLKKDELSSSVALSTRSSSGRLCHYGFGIFGNFDGQSVDRFLDDLSKCNHIQKMTFSFTDLAETIYKLGPAMINNNITRLVVEGCCLGVPGATFPFNILSDVNNLEELCIDCGYDNDHGLVNDLNDGGMADRASHRSISDDGLDVLILGLPTSVDMLDLGWTDVTLARQLPLLRFKKLHLTWNALSHGGPGLIAKSLANHECRLEELNLNRCNIGNEGAATLAEGLGNNQRLTRLSLADNNITQEGLNAFSSILCNPSSINATYNSNHTIHDMGGYGASQHSPRCGNVA
ncbi:hypothetical protein THAOC_33709, partial [Thalassiosira oceanica]